MPEPTGNAAFDAARAGGVVDTFLAFPDVAAEKAKVYDWIRKASLDKETQSMEMPAQYMFKDIPHYDEIDDPLEFVLTEMERFGIKRFVSNVAENEHAQRALREHPDKFWGILNVDPNTGMDALRRIDAAKEQWGDAEGRPHVGHRALAAGPARRQEDVSDLRQVRGGRPADLRVRRRARAPHPHGGAAADAARRGLLVLPRAEDHHPPRRRAVDRRHVQAAAQVAEPLLLDVRLRARSTTTRRSSSSPTPGVRTRCSTPATGRRAWRWTASSPSCPNVPFRDEVWPKFLRENAEFVLGGIPRPSDADGR